MRFGCDLPYFADPGEIRAFAQGVEAMGYHHIGFSEHLAASAATAYPPMITAAHPWHEATTLLAFLCGVTSTIELSTAMLLVTLRHPVLIAKQLAEIDLLSRHRLRVGMSVGWNREEQIALGVDPATRGDRLDETVPLLRRLWSEEEVTHAGSAFRLDRVSLHPRPQRTIPIWIGAGGLDTGGEPPDRALRRAARLADGFKLMAPTGRDVDHSIALAERLHEYAAEQHRTIGIEARLLTQFTPPDQWATVVKRYRESGVITHVGLGNRIVGGSVVHQLSHCREVLESTRSEW